MKYKVVSDTIIYIYIFFKKYILAYIQHNVDVWVTEKNIFYLNFLVLI